MKRFFSRIFRSSTKLKVQFLTLIAFNSYYLAPAGKYLCFPVLNCYACPIGTVACPIGSMTAFAMVRRIPYYVIGFIALIGISLGRALCGWACPFGLLQDGLFKIPTKKFKLPQIFNNLKYVLLIVLVLAVPFALGKSGTDATGGSARIMDDNVVAYDFCSLICPAGTLEAGIPGLIHSQTLRDSMSWKAGMKFGILAAALLLMVFSSRSFCRMLCPLGAAMALPSKVSLFQLHTNQDACTNCRKCIRVCPTDARKVPNTMQGEEASRECVLCLDCVKSCPEHGALAARIGSKQVMCSKGSMGRRDTAPEVVESVET